jgi:hypothetical protein
MEVIHIPVELDTDELLLKLSNVGLKSQEVVVRALIEESRHLIAPQAVYTFIEIRDIENDALLLMGSHVLNSVILADILESGQTIVPHVVTIGPRLEEKSSEEGKSNILRAWILDKIGNYALGKAIRYVKSCVENRLGNNLSRFEPGSEQGKLFSIEQQKILFDILDPSRHIAVNLTPNYLMIPLKSVSGVYAVTQHEYVACRFCPREKCDSRRKPFSGEYIATKCVYKD